MIGTRHVVLQHAVKAGCPCLLTEHVTTRATCYCPSCGLQVFDMLGFEPSMWNKINIHIGGTYGNTPEDKQATMERFIV